MTFTDIHPAEDALRLPAEVAQERPAVPHSGKWPHRLKVCA
jgi:hypothetical protein